MVDNDKNDDAAADQTGEQSGSVPDAQAGRAANAAPVTDVQAYIGRQLRAVYDDVAKQPIPDRFLALMQQLEAKGAG